MELRENYGTYQVWTVGRQYLSVLFLQQVSRQYICHVGRVIWEDSCKYDALALVMQ